MKETIFTIIEKKLGVYHIPLGLLVISVLFAFLGKAFSNLLFLSSLLYAFALFFSFFNIMFLFCLLCKHCFSKKISR